MLAYLSKLIIFVLLLLVVILYLHEYDVSTLAKLSSYLPFIDFTVIGIHTFLHWLGDSTKYQHIPDKGKGNNKRIERIYTTDELSEYTNERKGLYLAILGKVYDVGKGHKYYGEGGSYHFFTGRDGSRAFVTGDFDESGLTDDVLDLTSEDLRSLSDWENFYHKEYKFKGKVIGRYYDSEGKPTSYHNEVESLINKVRQAKADAENEKLKLPPCNVEWSQEEGSRVWCTKLSGGIKRDWVGVPRKYYEPGLETFRCACLNMESDPSYRKANLQEYPECNPKATSCHVNA